MERAMPQALPNHQTDPPELIEPTPRRPTVGDAMRRYWFLVLLVVAACGALGAYAGHQRKPVYEARASLSVGLLDLTTQSVPGFAVGGEVVAAGFSRAVQTDSIVLPVARELKMDPNVVRSRIISTPVPNGPIFTVAARGSSAPDAVRLANAVSRAMVNYGRSRSNSGPAFARMLDRYRAAVRDRDKARSHVTALRTKLSASTAAGTGSGASVSTAESSSGTAATSQSSAPKSGELAQAKADLEAKQLRVDSLAEAYRARASAPGTSAVVQPLVDAVGASSDRSSKMQLYGGLGALAGLCVGTAIAVMLTAFRYRRQRRRLS
jgi:uncharacterized protein involved in exopolysaccharide biosynthesis